MFRKSLLGILVVSVTAFIVYKYTDHKYWEEEIKCIPYETYS